MTGPLGRIRSQLLAEGKMPFGKHEGLLLSEVPAGYLLWIESNLDDFRTNNPELAQYIDENRLEIEERKKAETKAYFEEKRRKEKAEKEGTAVSWEEDQ